MLASMLVAALLLTAPAALSAQAIRGLVTDDLSGEQIAGVAVDAIRRDGSVAASAFTNSAGRLLLVVPAAGRYTLRLTHPSFQPVTTDEVQVGTDTLDVSLRMGRTSIPLRPLVVAAEIDARMAGFQARMSRGVAGQFLTRQRIEQRPGARTTDLLRELSGVFIQSLSAGAGRRVNMIRMRGGTGMCEPTIYVDGIVMRQYVDSPIDDLVKPDQLAGVEVYSGGGSAPPPIQSRDHCGVVAFWTRPVEDVERFSLWRVIAGATAVLGLLTIVLITR
jgi:hypothetical protein